MPVTNDYTEDFYYLKGRAARREIANQQIEQEREKAEQVKVIASIKALLAIDNLSIAQIAKAMNVTIEFVEKIKNT